MPYKACDLLGSQGSRAIPAALEAPSYGEPMIEAAGGVVCRPIDAMHVEVLLIHRPHRDDWSLPKGKLHRRESALDGALREVREETGLRCAAGIELPEAHYVDRRGRRKRVRYWAMEALAGSFRPNDEVDEVRWLHIDCVADLLTYRHDVAVVAGLRVVQPSLA